MPCAQVCALRSAQSFEQRDSAAPDVRSRETTTDFEVNVFDCEEELIMSSDGAVGVNTALYVNSSDVEEVV
jgi:hypothetical protein